MRKKAVTFIVVLVVTILVALKVLHISEAVNRQEEISNQLRPDDLLSNDHHRATPISTAAYFPISVRHRSFVRSTINATNFDKRKFKFIPLTPPDINRVEKFVIFVGYPRSGHSVIGSVIDGHPNAIIAHEYKLLDKCSEFNLPSKLFQSKEALFNALYRSSVYSAKGGWRSDSVTSKGYNLHTTEWHGNFSNLIVIGDKSGGTTAKYFYHNYTIARECYKQLCSTIQMPVLFIHVVRNPFDMIATGIVRKETGIEDMKRLISTQQKLEIPLKPFQDTTTSIFHFAKAVTRIKQFANVLEIRFEDYVRDPEQHVHMICSALDLPCPKYFVDACKKKVHRELTRTRDILEWPPHIRQRIEEEMNRYPFFSTYSFEGN